MRCDVESTVCVCVEIVVFRLWTWELDARGMWREVGAKGEDAATGSN